MHVRACLFVHVWECVQVKNRTFTRVILQTTADGSERDNGCFSFLCVLTASENNVYVPHVAALLQRIS